MQKAVHFDVICMANVQKITPFLWFDYGQGEKAAKFYTSIFKNSKILNTVLYGEAGPGKKGTVLTVEFSLCGQKFVALNGGPQFKFNEALSLAVTCESQEEVDELWEKLSDGGEEGQCGWLKDKYGLSWQIVPAELVELLKDKDTAKSQRVMKAILQMRKIDLLKLREAANGR